VHIVGIHEWGRKRERRGYIPYLQGITHVGVIFSLTREKVIEENITKAGRKEGEREGWEVREISPLLNAYGIIPYKDNHSVILSNHTGWLWI